jgi:hypothetical protein
MRASRRTSVGFRRTAAATRVAVPPGDAFAKMHDAGSLRASSQPDAYRYRSAALE